MRFINYSKLIDENTNTAYLQVNKVTWKDTIKKHECPNCCCGKTLPMLSGKFSIDLPRRYRASKPTHLTEIMHYLIKNQQNDADLFSAPSDCVPIFTTFKCQHYSRNRVYFGAEIYRKYSLIHITCDPFDLTRPQTSFQNQIYSTE